jgi:hypothetical protein
MSYTAAAPSGYTFMIAGLAESVAGGLGFEPRLTESESDSLFR